MEIWIVTDAASLDPRLYDAGLALLAPADADRVRRFYHRADACRCLLGRLLPRLLLASARRIPPAAIAIAHTPAGKPYYTTPGLDPPLAFNVSHDGAAVAIAFAPGTRAHTHPHAIPADLSARAGADADADAARAGLVGVDVMRAAVPPRTTFRELVRGVGDTLTPHERAQLAPPTPARAALRRFFWMWTLKEAFAKARGAGLAFELRRIECDVRAVDRGEDAGAEEAAAAAAEEAAAVSVSVTVDGAPPRGWAFVLFEFDVPHARAGADVRVGAGTAQARYQGVAARFVGGDAPPTFAVRRVGGSRLDARTDGAGGAGAEAGVVVYRDEAGALVERAVRVLGAAGGAGGAGAGGGGGSGGST